MDAEVVRDFQTGVAAGKAQRTQTLSLSAHEAAVQATACAGRTAFYRKVVYVEIWMNDCDVRALTGIMTAGGGVMAIAGGIISLTAIGIPIGVAVAIAGGLIAVGSGALQVCRSATGSAAGGPGQRRLAVPEPVMNRLAGVVLVLGILFGAGAVVMGVVMFVDRESPGPQAGIGVSLMTLALTLVVLGMLLKRGHRKNEGTDARHDG